MDPHHPDAATNAKNALRRDIDRHRHALARDVADLRHAADLPAKLREAVGKNTPTWLAGAGLAGFLLARRPGRRKSRKRAETQPAASPKPRALWLAALFALAKWLFAVGRPLLTEIAKKKLLEISLRRH